MAAGSNGRLPDEPETANPAGDNPTAYIELKIMPKKSATPIAGREANRIMTSLKTGGCKLFAPGSFLAETGAL